MIPRLVANQDNSFLMSVGEHLEPENLSSMKLLITQER